MFAVSTLGVVGLAVCGWLVVVVFAVGFCMAGQRGDRMWDRAVRERDERDGDGGGGRLDRFNEASDRLDRLRKRTGR